ncbi:EamA family transporter [Desulfosporosinus nitroreducens]|uniref:EamA family transporter n=1 Tax=Desulfosporosinus nitroreducens TaxID=2018668 RepID=UPI00207C5307|nr:DMT family transporter [Desulfosporosinus nitroreducens]MCO1602559.1 DMT family transporter [Desulfosporosinus nitroreducens]
MLILDKITKLPRHWLGAVQVTGAAVLWGTSATFAKNLFNNDLSPFDVAQMRLTLSFCLLVFVISISKPKLLRVRRSDLGYIAIFGIVGLGMLQFTYLLSLSLTNVATALFLQYTAPIIILVVGLILRTEFLTWIKIVALCASIGGGYMIVVGTTSGFTLNPVGVMYGLAAACTFAFYSMYGKRGLVKYNAWTLLTWGMGFGSLTWCIYQAPWTLAMRYGGLAWLQFLYIAVIATILPFGLYFKGLQNLSAFRAGMIGMLEPVVGAISAFFFLGELLTLTQLLGSGLILLGVALIQISALEKCNNTVYHQPELAFRKVGK